MCVQNSFKMPNMREAKRLIRIKVMRNWIVEAKSNNAIIDQEKLLAIACMEFGCSRRTALEYLNTLVNSGNITI